MLRIRPSDQRQMSHTELWRRAK